MAENGRKFGPRSRRSLELPTLRGKVAQVASKPRPSLHLLLDPSLAAPVRSLVLMVNLLSAVELNIAQMSGISKQIMMEGINLMPRRMQIGAHLHPTNRGIFPVEPSCDDLSQLN